VGAVAMRRKNCCRPWKPPRETTRRDNSTVVWHRTAPPSERKFDNRTGYDPTRLPYPACRDKGGRCCRSRRRAHWMLLHGGAVGEARGHRGRLQPGLLRLCLPAPTRERNFASNPSSSGGPRMRIRSTRTSTAPAWPARAISGWRQSPETGGRGWTNSARREGVCRRR
jgi:hypothetical protein